MKVHLESRYKLFFFPTIITKNFTLRIIVVLQIGINDSWHVNGTAEEEKVSYTRYGFSFLSSIRPAVEITWSR